MTWPALNRNIKKLIAMTSPPACAGRSVLLTFDDGPHPDVTPAVLDVLDRVGARSMFFVVGEQVSRTPELLLEIVRRGHLVGNHSFSHDTTLGFRDQLTDLRYCQEVVNRTAAFSPKYVRPPYGNIRLPILFAAWRLNLRIMLWSFDSLDWKLRSREAADIRAEEIASSLRNRSSLSEILLCHDDNPYTVRMLEQVLPVLVNSGYNLCGAIQALNGAAR